MVNIYRLSNNTLPGGGWPARGGSMKPVIVVLGAEKKPEGIGHIANWVVHQDLEKGLENIAMLKRHGYSFNVALVYLTPNPPERPLDFMEKLVQVFGPKCLILVISELGYVRLPSLEYGCVPCHPERVSQTLTQELKGGRS